MNFKHVYMGFNQIILTKEKVMNALFIYPLELFYLLFNEYM